MTLLPQTSVSHTMNTQSNEETIDPVNEQLENEKHLSLHASSKHPMEVKGQSFPSEVHHHHHHPSSILYFKPKEVVEKLQEEGKRKSKLGFDQIILLSLFSGVYVGLGSMVAILTAGNSPTLETENPGLQKLIFGS